MMQSSYCVRAIASANNDPHSVLLFGLWNSHSWDVVTKSKGGVVTDAIPKYLLFGL